MPRPPQMVRAVLIGRLPQGEEFQTGFWMQQSPATNISQAALQAESDAMAASFFNTTMAIRDLITTATTYQSLRLYYYPGGTNPRASIIAETTLAAGGSGSGQTLLPLQVGLVATLRTGIAGRRFRGRMYLPMNAQTLGDHQVGQTMINNVASALANWFNAINSGTTLGLTVVVLSEVAGTAQPVTGVDVDSRPDVQRRRAAQQAELRQAVTGVVT